MTRFLKGFWIFLMLTLVYSPLEASLISLGKPPVNRVSIYPSAQAAGLIGVTEEAPYDNPVDNIFHVNLTNSLCTADKVWLVYELEGVEDHTHVARSINDQVAIGGYLVKKRSGWATQREQLNPAWLKDGDNIVRFTMPENAEHSYRIRNLRLEVEKADENIQDDANIVFNQPSSRYFFDKAYIKGLVTGSAAHNIRIKVEGKEARMFNGEFESIVDFTSNKNTCSVEVEAVFPDGTTRCYTVTFSEPVYADYHFSVEHYTYRTEKYFDVKKTETIALNGASLTSDTDALKTGALLSITTLRTIDIPALDAGMVNVTKNHAGFRFLPHGMIFDKEVSMRIGYDESKIPDGYTEQDIRTYYFDEQSHHWVPVTLDTVLTESGEIVSKTIHFTDFINAIIKVPESPEVAAYNSTSIKGIKAANPTAGIGLINPPQANNTGNASLSYPLNIPAGRNGMQPQLAISYNSGGGNGWLGLGWNLTIPAITIDTRWGAPRYDDAWETETYTMNGEQLSPVAHRGDLKRREAEKIFHPRVEGAFNKIIRHGNNPREYWWEVIDKSGTRYFYGGDENGVNEGATLSGVGTTLDANNRVVYTQNNKAYWPLRKVIDLNGNYILYQYDKAVNTGLAGGKVPGYQLYISEISYTHHRSGSGLYTVKFIRQTGRPDVQISGNLGFKMVTADLLQQIDIKFDGQPIRSYKLEYINGEFSKKLLGKISELDSKGENFTTHEFDYHNDVRKGNEFKPMEANRAWTMPGDDIKGRFIAPERAGFTPEATAISGTKSTDKTVGVSIGVGLGFNVFSKMATAAISGGYSASESEGMLLMIDMNGDGLQDKVYIKNGTIHYRANLSRTEEKFSTQAIAVTGEGVDAFFKEKSRTTSVGAEVSIGAFAGYSRNWTTSKTMVYFADVNGDQLPDIVRNGIVYFNHLDPQTGAITYSRFSTGTPNEIVAEGPMSNDLLDRDALERERQEAIDQNPLLDIVRMWKAPYTGQIKITAPVQLLRSESPDRAEAPADGVRVMIQLQDSKLWDATIAADNYTVHTPTGVGNVSVNKGDLLFFRLGSRDNGEYDSVRWEPVIEYLNQPQDLKDPNNKRMYRFSAKDDYILSSDQTIAPPVDGRIRVTGLLSKRITTDDVALYMIKKDTLGNVLDTVWRKKYTWNKTVSQFPDTTLAVRSGNEVYTFKVVTGSNIDWNALAFRPKLVYESVQDDPDVNLSETPIEVYAVAEYSLYANELRMTKPFNVKLGAVGQRDTLKIKPKLEFKQRGVNARPFTGEITFTAKKADTLLAKQVLIIRDSALITNSVLNVPVKHGDDIFMNTIFAMPIWRTD